MITFPSKSSHKEFFHEVLLMHQLAFIGCAHIHVPDFIKNIKARPDIKVKSVWDPNPVRSQQRGEELGAAVAADFKSILDDSQIEAVIICSETNRHEELVLPTAAAKKNMFVEKPLGFAATDARKMADAIEKAGVLFHTGYGQRGNAKHVFLKEQIANGAFGKITRIRGSNCHSGALGGWFDTNTKEPANDWRWMADPKQSGCGAFGDLGTHSLDIMIWLMGDVTAVTAQVDRGTGRYGDCDETGEGMLRFKNGAIGTLASAWVDVANPVSLLISGTEGHAAIINNQLFFQSKNVEGADGKEPWTKLPAAPPAAMDAFLEAIAGKKNVPLVSAREAAYRSVVMGAMYEGAKTGSWVNVK
jgi:predicted dehydrogenase